MNSASEHSLLKGIVQSGTQIASGASKVDPRFGQVGSLELQRPFFQKLGVPNLDDFYLGTINLRLDSPVEILRPHFHLGPVEWYPGITESFQLLEFCFDSSKPSEVAGYIYRPYPSDHAAHGFDVLELWLPFQSQKATELQILVEKERIRFLS